MRLTCIETLQRLSGCKHFNPTDKYESRNALTSSEMCEQAVDMCEKCRMVSYSYDAGYSEGYHECGIDEKERIDYDY